MWAGIKHVAKRNAAIVMTASQPFTSALVMSNPAMFKHVWTWIKDKPVGHLVAKKRPMQASEDVAVFCAASPAYNPIMIPLEKPYYGGVETRRSEICGGKQGRNERKLYTHRYPTTLLRFTGVPHGKNVHPTQKPVALMEYLIRTYTNEGETVLDFTMGSGSTGVACRNTGRNFIGIELDAAYFEIARERIGE
jgi:site-specific DNA-methyltransferase (adenine-specific)